MLRFDLSQDSRSRLYSGITEPAVPAITTSFLARHPAPLVFLLDKSLNSAEQWAEDTGFFMETYGLRKTDWDFHAFPNFTEAESGNDPRATEIFCDRLAVLSALSTLKKNASARALLIATTPEALLSRVPPHEEFRSARITLEPGLENPFQKLVSTLARDFDYDSEAVCEQPGQFAVRGGLIDIYPVNDHQPYRIDFFGDVIESIRTFDPTTQRTIEAADQVTIVSGKQSPLRECPGGLIDYLPDRPVAWILREPDSLEYHYPQWFHIPEKPSIPKASMEAARRRVYGDHDHWLGIVEIDRGDGIFHEPREIRSFHSEPLSNYRSFPGMAEVGLDRFESEQRARENFLQQLLNWQRENFAIHVVCRSEGEETRLGEILARDPVLKKLRPTILRGGLHQGFLFRFHENEVSPAPPGMEELKGMVVVTDSEIFGRYRTRLTRLQHRKLPDHHQVDQLLDFTDLTDGDPVVHLQHGICLFRGLSKIEIEGREKEVITLEFDEGARLHVPLHESHVLSRYIGLTKSSPKLGKLGSRSWEKARASAEKATLDFAAELLNLQARRSAVEGYAFNPDHPWLKEFESSFIYTETPDQLTAIRSTRKDLAHPRPMDRLICGDVGFGKTEVALRAAFMAVLEGKQVAMLVPTTVLCQQHFNTFRERMADYPVVVEMVSRFRSPAQNGKILKEVSEGRIDILIGTHRLLSGDVHFHQLGLIVVDEEQRFGVKHKEKLKAMKAHVDVLTLSATPIPRTLYMALVSAREMSVIETPPQDRLPIRTIVKAYSTDLIQKAVRHETARGGQVFYLHNRVKTIKNVAAQLETQFPDLRIAVGHGQMDESQLEHIMTRFVAGEFDVLVCTTIIESGIDIPNCNTIIIEGADQFGLSQLYQLRGRVGRFKRQAYCYLLLHRKTHLKDHARKRLTSIRQYNQLGSGFRIAMRDLELRGAGNLLGAEQSGHIAGVGFDLYCQLLRQSVARLKGDNNADVIRASLRLDFIIMGEQEEGAPVRKTHAGSAEVRRGYSILKADTMEREKIEALPVFIPGEYITETRLRIDFYRQLAMASSREKVDEIEAALKDRFGPVPRPTQGLLLTTKIRVLAEQKGIQSVQTEGNRLKLRFAHANKDVFFKTGLHFPRLCSKEPLARLEEIHSYLNQKVS